MENLLAFEEKPLLTQYSDYENIIVNLFIIDDQTGLCRRTFNCNDIID